MRLLPTGLGAKGGLFFAAVFTLFLATPYSNLFFLLTAFLAVLGVLGIAGAWLNLRGVAVEAVQVPAGPADLPHEVLVRLSLGRQLPGRRGPGRGRRCFGLSVGLELDCGVHLVGHVAVADGSAVVHGRLEGLDRGVRRLIAVRLRSRHPFGVCMAERRLPVAALEVVTYPRPARFGDGVDGPDPRIDSGRLTVPATAETVAGLREWRAGDAFRQIDWKATARRGAPIVKEHERDSDDGVEVAIDRRCSDEELERALSAATRILLDASHDHRPLRLCSQDFEARHGPDVPAIHDSLRWLAAARPLPASAGPPTRRSPDAIVLPANGTPGASRGVKQAEVHRA